MSYIFADIIASAFPLLQSVAGESVIYHRGEHSVSLVAVPGKTDFESADGGGVKVESRSKTYTIVAAELVLDDEIIKPKRDDLIKQTIGGKVHVFEVVNPFGEQVWQYADGGQTAMRVFVRLKVIE